MEGGFAGGPHDVGVCLSEEEKGMGVGVGGRIRVGMGDENREGHLLPPRKHA